MTEPVTTNKTLIVPNTGDLSGAWGTSALNPNFQTIDAMFGGVTTISLSATTTILLTVPATTGIWPGSLSQSVNAMIRFTGAQTGSATIQFTLPGFYIIDNQCTGTTSIRLQPANLTGNTIGVAQGRKTHVFFDGTHMDYANPDDPGTALDLHGYTSLPPYMSVCTIQPYLVKDGSVYNVSSYTALANVLGSTFGGNGVTTFAVPDERARARLALDTIQAASGATSARVTFPIAGFTGSLMGAAGGDQRLQTHSHGITDPQHSHTPKVNNSAAGGTNPENTWLGAGSAIYSGGNNAAGGPTNLASTGITINPQGTGSSQNMPPSIISFLPLIKT